MKKIIALILTALLILAMPAVSAFAAGKDMDSASLIESGKTYKGNTEEARWYKINTEKGVIRINAQITRYTYYGCAIHLYNKDGAEVYPDSTSSVVGSVSTQRHFVFKASSDTERFKGYAEYSVKKSTYYIKIESPYSVHNYKFKVTTPGAGDKSSDAKLVGFSTAMKAGEILTLNPLTSASGAKVTWSTSDKTVATVSGGKITAVKAGTADITCKCGTTSMTIRVKVS